MSLLNKIEDPLLKRVEAEVQRRLVPRVREAYKHAVNAGMEVAAHNGPQGLRALTDSDDPVKACAMAGANFMLMLFKQTNMAMPQEVVPPAALTLMLQAMDLLDKAGIREASVEDINKGTRIQVERIMAASGITMPVLDKMAGEVRSILNDPMKREQLNLRAGTVRDPRASTPTEVPEPTPEPEAEAEAEAQPNKKGLLNGV